MYTLLPVSVQRFALTVGALVVLGVWWAVDRFDLSWSAFRTAAAAVSFVSLGVVLTFGSSGYRSPWRVLWRLFPALNSVMYPDLNGVWIGETRSNWPVINRTREAAMADHAASPDELRDVDLQHDPVAIELRVSLFRIVVIGALSNTGAGSQSITAKVVKDPESENIRLHYIYKQETPDPISTDETTHVGAASITFEKGDYQHAEGIYWTRRKWREGMNTAGAIHLDKQTDRYDPSQKKLRYYISNDQKLD